MRESFRPTALRVALVVPFALAACSSDGPTGEGELEVAGSYAATFASTETTNCQGVVEPGSTTGILTVTQAGPAVTLHLRDLDERFASDPVGVLSTGGTFQYVGPVLLDPDGAGGSDMTFSAQGTFQGTFTAGSLDIDFDFGLLGCTVIGHITGQKA